MTARAMRMALLAIAFLSAVACGGGGDGEGSQTTQVPQTGITAAPYIVRGSLPPVAVSWRIGITEDVTEEQMRAFYATLVATNNAVWNVSEEQVRIHEVSIRDRVAPGVTTSQFMADPSVISTAELDIIVWPVNTWDIPAGGAVTAGGNIGRANRLMVVPMNAPVFVLLHETSHLIWDLTWASGPMLNDEYLDGVQDEACVMESQNLPLRWCSDANHVHQQSQPHACWHQILLDYPAFTHKGIDLAPGTPQSPLVAFIDT